MKFFYLFLILITVLLCITACSKYLEKKFIFRPKKLDTNFKFEFGIPKTEFNVESGDHLLNALYFPALDGNPKATILYYHGNSKNLNHWAKNVPLFVKKGYEVYIYDYPQFGKSKGDLVESKLYQDAINFYDHVINSKKHESDIILYGRSLGTTFASYTATKRKAKKLILETPFNNMKTMFKLKAPFGLNIIRVSYKFPTDEFLPKISCPIHIIQGDRDRVVPYESAVLLKPLLKDKDSFTKIKNGKHSNLADFEKYHQLINKIL